MKKIYPFYFLSALIGLLGFISLVFASRENAQEDIWKLLFKVEWQKKYNAELKIKVDAPKFSPEIKALDNQEITVGGYIIPVELYGGGDYIILSAYPTNQCFFCGGAGPESVMEVYLQSPRSKFNNDRVTLKGKLVLNENDHNHLIYLLKNAVLIK